MIAKIMGKTLVLTSKFSNFFHTFVHLLLLLFFHNTFLISRSCNDRGTVSWIMLNRNQNLHSMEMWKWYKIISKVSPNYAKCKKFAGYVCRRNPEFLMASNWFSIPSVFRGGKTATVVNNQTFKTHTNFTDYVSWINLLRIARRKFFYGRHGVLSVQYQNFNSLFLEKVVIGLPLSGGRNEVRHQRLNRAKYGERTLPCAWHLR